MKKFVKKIWESIKTFFKDRRKFSESLDNEEMFEERVRKFRKKYSPQNKYERNRYDDSYFD